MNTLTFLKQHGIERNPFAEEDAQTDPVFKQHCIENAYHPAWDKVYGDPTEPATAIIFGPKGSGKTAMRLQVERHLVEHNANHPGHRNYIVRYDDFNPFLDHFTSRLGRAGRKPDKALDNWRLWDHMDSILCLGVTDMINQILAGDRSRRKVDGNSIDRSEIENLDRNDARDLLLLAACYDQSTDSTFGGRFDALQKLLGYKAWRANLDLILGAVGSVIAVAVALWLYFNSGGGDAMNANFLWIIPAGILAFMAPFLIRWTRMNAAAAGIRRHMRVGKRDTKSLRGVLMRFPAEELAAQPMPRYNRTDDRYELLRKFQGLLGRLGFDGIIVLMDRVDEPHMLGGKPELMRRFVWPLLDNKLLKHPGVGFKMMLPEELYRDTERESREFHERARLDKQNVIPSFAWTGESMYDLVRARMLACAADGADPQPKDLFDDTLSYERMLTAFESLRVPRHLFRFLYRVVSEHCNKHSDAAPSFKIGASTFETALAVYNGEMARG